MATVFKALTRPALLLGIPLTPFILVCGLIVLAALYITKFLLLLMPISGVVMRLLARHDAQIFSLTWLKLKTGGNKKCNHHYDAIAYLANDYDNVDMTAFNQAMRLNDRATLTKIIPYSSHVHENIIKTKKTDLIATWEVGGTAFDGEEADNLAIRSAQLNTLIKSFEGQPVTFYVHNVRDTFFDHFEGKSGNAFADTLSQRYYDHIKQQPFRRNRLFFTVCYQPFAGIDKIERKRMSRGQKQHTLTSAIQEMQEIRTSLEVALARFTAKALGTFEDNGGVFSSQLSFYHFLISGRWQKIRVTRTPFYETVGSADVFFSGESGQRNTWAGKSFFRMLEIKDFTPETTTGMMEVLLYIPCNYVLTQSYTCMAKEEAQKHIKRAARHLISAEDDAVSQQEDLAVALDMLQAGDIAFGQYHFSLMVLTDTLESLVKETHRVANALSDVGFIPTLSSLSLPAAFFAQLPGVYTLRPRLVPISSQNFVELASLHNFYAGKRDQTPWGDAIAVLRTPGQGAYYLNLHHTLLFKDDFNEKTLGNTSVIGTTGSGKTLLLNFIACMLQKFSRPETFSVQAKSKRLTTVYLDKDRGAELNVRALGGRYYPIKKGEPTGWNPFKLPANKRNVTFVKQLIKLLCHCGGCLTPREDIRLSRAVEAVMLDLPAACRVYGISRLLENLTEPTTQEAQENGLRIRLSPWAQGGEWGWVFDNAEETFNVDECDNVGIDGTEFLDDKAICAPIAFYLLYRITGLLDGRRLVIFLDEFWKWLDDEAFSDFVYNKLKTIRKLNGLVISATQSPAEILKSPIAPAVVEQCGTQIFLANPKADRKDYVEGLKVAPEIFDIIKGIDPLSRQFVVIKSPLKRGDLRPFAALVTLDLSGLGVYTKILSTSADNLEIFDSIFKDGMKPEEWLTSYLKLAL